MIHADGQQGMTGIYVCAIYHTYARSALDCHGMHGNVPKCCNPIGRNQVAAINTGQGLVAPKYSKINTILT